MTPVASTFAGVVVGLLEALAAQTPAPPPPDTSTALHAAWLREVMDLDVLGASRDYATVHQRARANEPERWIAVARLAELQRMGLPVGPPAGLAEAPAPVRAAITSMPPLPADELLPPLSFDPADLMHSLGAGRIPPLRPASATVLDWVRSQLGGSLDGRMRQQLPFGSRTRPDRDRARAERWYAADVLLRELEGRQQQAASLRRFYFSEWKPPPVEADPIAVLARVQTNFDAWLGEKDLTQQQQALLQQLREALRVRGAEDPAAAVQFLLRMPLYAERLAGPLRPVESAATQPGEPPAPKRAESGDAEGATPPVKPQPRPAEAPGLGRPEGPGAPR